MGDMEAMLCNQFGIPIEDLANSKTSSKAANYLTLMGSWKEVAMCILATRGLVKVVREGQPAICMSISAALPADPRQRITMSGLNDLQKTLARTILAERPEPAADLWKKLYEDNMAIKNVQERNTTAKRLEISAIAKLLAMSLDTPQYSYLEVTPRPVTGEKVS